jgi:hypothetical protein
MKTPPSPDPHPLQNVVLRAFEERERQNASKLAMYMSGSASSSSKRGAERMKAYQVVAEDVLRHMESQGLIYKDDHGWYRKGGGK